MAYGVWATGFTAILVVAAAAGFDRGPRRTQVIAYVAPPTVVWLAYMFSLGTYNNFHAGYAILNQVIWLWTGGALVAAALEWSGSWPVLRKAAVAVAWIVACVIGVGMLTFFAPRTNYRALAAAASVPIPDYTAKVLGVIPVRARTWGSVEFGIEHPHRIQLIQFWDGLKIVEVIAPDRHAPLAPDYLVWGPVENGASTREVLSAADRVRAGAERREIHVGPQRLLEAFPDMRYTLVSMVAGPPYGVTRVYAWTAGAPALERPLIDVYDPKERQWSSATGPAQSIAVTPAKPVTLMAGTEATASIRTATQTVAGQLAPGRYLLRVSMSAALTPGEPIALVASPAPEIHEDIAEPSAGIDVSPWFAGEQYVYLVYRHAGGPVYVSQFGTGAGGIAGVEALPVMALTDYAGARRVLPPEHGLPASAWIPSFPAITLTPAPSGGVAVAGDKTQFGYQAYGPRIEVKPGLRMRLRVPVAVAEGRACLGVLDGTEERWIVAPDRLMPEYEFQINDSTTVKPVLANCSGSPKDVVPVQATIGDGSYALWSDKEDLYVDQLMREFRNARPR